MAVLFAFQLRLEAIAKIVVVARELLESQLDLALLGFGKGNDADAQASILRQEAA